MRVQDDQQVWFDTGLGEGHLAWGCITKRRLCVAWAPLKAQTRPALLASASGSATLALDVIVIALVLILQVVLLLPQRTPAAIGPPYKTTDPVVARQPWADKLGSLLLQNESALCVHVCE